MIKEIAEEIYKLFVINRKAIAVQTKDGDYLTKYIDVSADDIRIMINNGNSLGCYQQLYKSPYLKWICFDFDCFDKENPDIEGLYMSCTLPLNHYLDRMNIAYVNEFSGRRGIHTWILFDEFVEKKYAYLLLDKIINDSHLCYDNTKYGLDRFPSTPNSNGNTLGKQVKIPLSTHVKGVQSFFFKGNFKYEKYDETFYGRQFNILQNVRVNKKSEILKMVHKKDVLQTKYIRMYTKDELKINEEEIIDILSEIRVYREIFKRLQEGNSHPKDWFVLLGTLGKVKNGETILTNIYKYSPNYSEEETIRKIAEYRNIYYPATFRYLYSLYNLEIEDNLNPDENALQYLTQKLELNIEECNWGICEKDFLEDSKYTISKELFYLFINDEVPVVSIYSDLVHMTSYDSFIINRYVKEIENGSNVSIEPSNYHVFSRVESEIKTRKMVSLCAFDRVLTTHLALRMFYNLSGEIRSYSYNPNYLSNRDVFFHWYSSWANYLSNIRKYLEIDLYNELNVMSLDISKFYDSIDFLGVYRLIETKLSVVEKNIMHFLIKYNESLMCAISENRKGVPQGPAYARLIAEVFLGVMIDCIEKELESQEAQIKIYRYVDDIVIFYDDSIEGDTIYDTFNKIMVRNGLSLNKDKSRIYGKIKKLTEVERAELLRNGQFQYGLRETDFSYLLEDEYINVKVEALINKKGKFDMASVPFFFSKYTDERAKKLFFNKYAYDIFGSCIGRGSAFTGFYKYLLENQEALEKCFSEKMIYKIPINTINFSCFLAAIFYYRTNNVDSRMEITFDIENYLRELDITKIESEEDRSIILALVGGN